MPSLSEHTLPGFVLAHRNDPNPLVSCQTALISLFSLDGVVRASTKDPDILACYLGQNTHRSLFDLYSFCSQSPEEKPWKDELGFRILLYSPELFIPAQSGLPLSMTKRIELSTLTSEKMLNKEIS